MIERIRVGRGRRNPIAPEGALKLKEISCIDAESYPSGEFNVFADGDSEIPEIRDVHILGQPEHYCELSPILHVIPLSSCSSTMLGWSMGRRMWASPTSGQVGGSGVMACA